MVSPRYEYLFKLLSATNLGVTETSLGNATHDILAALARWGWGVYVAVSVYSLVPGGVSLELNSQQFSLWLMRCELYVLIWQCEIRLRCLFVCLIINGSSDQTDQPSPSLSLSLPLFYPSQPSSPLALISLNLLHPQLHRSVAIVYPFQIILFISL